MARWLPAGPRLKRRGFRCWAWNIRQALAPRREFSNQYPVVGSRLLDHSPRGLSIREDENPITGNTSRLLPHVIL
jgi:glutathionylspermidine synthase